jgi:hypothetical protein
VAQLEGKRHAATPHHYLPHRVTPEPKRTRSSAAFRSGQSTKGRGRSPAPHPKTVYVSVH